MYISAGDNIMINAKSLLGACALIGSEARLVVSDHIPEQEFLNALKDLFTE